MRDQSGASEEKNENEWRGQMESVQMFVDADVECTLLMRIRAIFDMVSCTYTGVPSMWTRMERAGCWNERSVLSAGGRVQRKKKEQSSS